MKFIESPEGQEYIGKIQAGNVIPHDPSPLETEALVNLHKCQKKLQTLTANQSELERQLAAGKKQADTLSREIDLATGELRAFAQVLLFAEGARRDAKQARREVAEGQKPDEDPTDGSNNEDRVAKSGRTGKNGPEPKGKRALQKQGQGGAPPN